MMTNAMRFKKTAGRLAIDKGIFDLIIGLKARWSDEQGCEDFGDYRRMVKAYFLENYKVGTTVSRAFVVTFYKDHIDYVVRVTKGRIVVTGKCRVA